MASSDLTPRNSQWSHACLLYLEFIYICLIMKTHWLRESKREQNVLILHTTSETALGYRDKLCWGCMRCLLIHALYPPSRACMSGLGFVHHIVVPLEHFHTISWSFPWKYIPIDLRLFCPIFWQSQLSSSDASINNSSTLYISFLVVGSNRKLAVVESRK